jgi:hypothetical protein
MIQAKQVTRESIEINGIPCTIAQIVSKPGRSGATATLFPLRGVHSMQSVIDAYPEAMKRAGAVKTEWIDSVEDRSEVGRDHRAGTINGFQWFADWQGGCRVFLVTGPEVRHREDVRKATVELQAYFEKRLKTVPTSLDVIRHSDARAREFYLIHKGGAE